MTPPLSTPPARPVIWRVSKRRDPSVATHCDITVLVKAQSWIEARAEGMKLTGANPEDLTVELLVCEMCGTTRIDHDGRFCTPKCEARFKAGEVPVVR